MRHLIWIAIVLIAVYLALRLAAGVVHVALHLLLVIGVILLIMWVIGKIRGKGTRVP